MGRQLIFTPQFYGCKSWQRCQRILAALRQRADDLRNSCWMIANNEHRSHNGKHHAAGLRRLRGGVLWKYEHRDRRSSAIGGGLCGLLFKQSLGNGLKKSSGFGFVAGGIHQQHGSQGAWLRLDRGNR